MGGNFLQTSFWRGAGLGDGEVEVVNVVPVMPHLAFIEIAQGVTHGAGGVGGEVAFGRIEKPRGMGECFLSGQLNFGMRQAGNIMELPGDFGRERKELEHLIFHAVET
ncbi:MAG: hypothetical protein RLZZ398_1398 [Verrucomicrobiota bacterium]